MSPPQHDDQHEAKPMENTPSSERSTLSRDPVVLAIFLVFILLFSPLLPHAWPLIVGVLGVLGVVGLGLVIRWGILWYEKRRRSDL